METVAARSNFPFPRLYRTSVYNSAVVSLSSSGLLRSKVSRPIRQAFRPGRGVSEHPSPSPYATMFFFPASQPGDQLLIPAHIVYPRRIPTKIYSITAGQSHGPTLEQSSFDRAPFPGESSLIDIQREVQSGSRHSHSSQGYCSSSIAYIGADERREEEVWAVIHSQAAQYRLERITRGETGSESVRGCLDVSRCYPLFHTPYPDARALLIHSEASGQPGGCRTGDGSTGRLSHS